MAASRAPADLGTKGRALWTKTLAVYDLAAHELVTLEAACREVDLIADMEKALKGAQMVVKGSMGQSVAHPLLAEVRQHRAAYISFIKALALPESDEPAVPKPDNGRRAQAQAAANARWAKRGA